MFMKTNIKATNITITPAISEYIEKKLESVTKYFKNLEEVVINIEVGKSTRHHKQGDVFLAELHVINGGQDYYVQAHKEDLYAAIDEAKDDLIREMSSRRKRALRLVRRGGVRLKNMIKNLNPWRSR
jgi:putative sigma-54 modulation protein